MNDERRADFLDTVTRSTNLPFTPEEADLIERVGRATQFFDGERLIIDSMIRKYAHRIGWRP